jgi:hypothetical protein
MVMAPRLVSARGWTANTVYGHGDMVRNTNRRNLVYWNVSGDLTKHLSTNMPSHLHGDVLDGDTNVWRRIPPKARQGFVVQNNGDSIVWISIGSTAVTNRGITLTSGSSYFIDGDLMQDSIHAISFTDLTNAVTTQEY